MRDVNTGVYEIICLPNGMRYVGSSRRSLLNRFSWHRTVLKQNAHCNKFLQRDWKFYGVEQFEFKIVKCCSPARVFFFEQQRMDYWESRDKLYNILPLAESALGFQATPEQRKRQSEKAKLRCTPAWRKAVSVRVKKQHAEGRFGNRLPAKPPKPKLTKEAYRAQCVRAALKRWQNPEYIKKRSGKNHRHYGKPGFMLGRKWSPESRKRMRRVAKERELKRRKARGNYC